MNIILTLSINCLSCKHKRRQVTRFLNFALLSNIGFDWETLTVPTSAVSSTVCKDLWSLHLEFSKFLFTILTAENCPHRSAIFSVFLSCCHIQNGFGKKWGDRVHAVKSKFWGAWQSERFLLRKIPTSLHFLAKDWVHSSRTRPDNLLLWLKLNQEVKTIR